MAASIGQEAGAFQPLQSVSRREILAYLLLFTGLLLMVLVGLFAFQYIMPRPNLVMLGKLSDFPPSAEPYVYIGEHRKLFIVNTGAQLSVLDSEIPHPTVHCLVQWVSPNQRFEDPCLGTKFALNGGYLDGPGRSHLTQYQMQAVGDGKLYANLDRPIVEAKAEFIRRCLIAQYNGIETVQNRSWGDASYDQFCEDFWQTMRRDQVIH